MSKQKSDTQVAPQHLKPRTRAWFAAVVRDYRLEGHHLRLLQAAAEQWDRAQDARRAIGKDGLLITDPRGHLRPHPAVRIERESKSLFCRLLRELGLDLAGPDEAPRPTALVGRAGR